MLVSDAPIAVDLAQAHGQAKQETVLVSRVGGRIGTATHNDSCKSDVMAGSHGKLFNVERCSRLMAAKHQFPSLFVSLNPLALQGRRKVEHHDIRRVMSEDGGNVMAADGIRPGFEQGPYPVLFDIGEFWHVWPPIHQGRTSQPECDIESIFFCSKRQDSRSIR